MCLAPNSWDGLLVEGWVEPASRAGKGMRQLSSWGAWLGGGRRRNRVLLKAGPRDLLEIPSPHP